MKTTSEILERISKSSENHKDGVFTRLYRYLLREDIYFIAYQKLYANKGAMTKGIDNDTADGFGIKYINKLIDELRTLTYNPKPVKRHYIRKQNGKMRPLGIPSFRDKLLQEAVRIILESIYEPVFNNNSHGFRPDRSCHTALDHIKIDFRSAKWFIEGDIKACFDKIDHQKLIIILQRKIKDSKFINIIRSFLKAGYIEDLEYNKTLSGAPQGGIISPILANIFLNELDEKMESIKNSFDKPLNRQRTKEYSRLHSRCRYLSNKIKESSEKDKSALLKEYKSTLNQKLKTPCKLPEDKKIAYVRYCDDFLIGVIGDKNECLQIKEELTEFLGEALGLELSPEKTLITHSSIPVRFLGYDIKVRRNQEVKKRSDGVKMRTLNNSVEIAVPLKDKIEKFLFINKIVRKNKEGKLLPISRPQLMYKDDKDILDTYNSEFRGICNYYCKAVNYYKLNYFRYFMEYSCLKTIAAKHNSSVAKVYNKYRNYKTWAIPYQTKTGIKLREFTELSACKSGKYMRDIIPKTCKIPKIKSQAIQKRLMAGKCELCGTDGKYCEVHHAGSMKAISKSTEWGKKMLKMRRKTLVVCEKCHNIINISEPS